MQSDTAQRLAAEFVQHSEMISLVRQVEMITDEMVLHRELRLTNSAFG